MKALAFFKSMKHGVRRSLSQEGCQEAESVSGPRKRVRGSTKGLSSTFGGWALSRDDDHLRLGMHNFRRAERETLRVRQHRVTSDCKAPLKKGRDAVKPTKAGGHGDIFKGVLPFASPARCSEKRRVRRQRVVSSNSSGSLENKNPLGSKGRVGPKGARIDMRSVRGHEAGTFWLARWIYRNGTRVCGPFDSGSYPDFSSTGWDRNDRNYVHAGVALDMRWAMPSYRDFRLIVEVLDLLPDPKKTARKGFRRKGITRQDKRRSFREHFVLKSIPRTFKAKLSKRSLGVLKSRALQAWKHKTSLPREWWLKRKEPYSFDVHEWQVPGWSRTGVRLLARRAKGHSATPQKHSVSKRWY